MTAINTLEGIRPEEVGHLEGMAITTLDELWAYIEAYGLDRFGRRSGIKLHRLLGLLLAEGDLVPMENQAGFTVTDLWVHVAKFGLDALAPAAGPVRDRLVSLLEAQGRFQATAEETAGLGRYALEIALAGLVLFLLAVGLRAGGRLAARPPPFGLSQKVLVLTRDLPAGHVLQAGDMVAARLNGADYFPAGEDVSGLTLVQAVQRGRPLRFAHVSRLQVTAADHIAAGAEITKEMVKLEPTPYRPDAALRVEEVVGRAAGRGIQKGEVITTGSLRP